MRLGWEELNTPKEPTLITPRYQLPDLSEEQFEAILKGQEDLATMRQLFPEVMTEFVDECYKPHHLNKITEADITKFMTSKPDLPPDEVREKLPEWLHDKLSAFLPQLADELPPRRS